MGQHISSIQEAAPATPELVLGKYEQIELPVEQYVVLPQVRDDVNPDTEKIKLSIKGEGLMNPIDVARMDENQLTEHLRFINRVWNTNVTIEDYAAQKQTDGNYYVIIAGHTRREAIMQMRQEDNLPYQVVAKIHKIESSADFIFKQLAENTYHHPRLEQRAIAIIETYEIGLEQGTFKTKQEYLDMYSGIVSKETLLDAIGFAQLPQFAKAFVFSKTVSYAAGVALGRATDTIAEFTASELGYHSVPWANMDDKFLEAYNMKIALLIQHIYNKTLNSSASIKYISGQVAEMKEKINAATPVQTNGHSTGMLPLFEDAELKLSDNQGNTYLKALTHEYHQALAEMKRKSVISTTTALKLHAELSANVAPIEDRKELLTEAIMRLKLLANNVEFEDAMKAFMPRKERKKTSRKVL